MIGATTITAILACAVRDADVRNAHTVHALESHGTRWVAVHRGIGAVDGELGRRRIGSAAVVEARVGLPSTLVVRRFVGAAVDLKEFVVFAVLDHLSVTATLESEVAATAGSGNAGPVHAIFARGTVTATATAAVVAADLARAVAGRTARLVVRATVTIAHAGRIAITAAGGLRVAESHAGGRTRRAAAFLFHAEAIDIADLVRRALAAFPLAAIVPTLFAGTIRFADALTVLTPLVGPA